MGKRAGYGDIARTMGNVTAKIATADNTVFPFNPFVASPKFPASRENLATTDHVICDTSARGK